MNASTIIYACNYSGFQVPKTVAGWGVTQFDWSNNRVGWASAVPMNDDEDLLTQAQMIKGDPSTKDYTKVGIYRNSVYGYPWFTSVRRILDAPEYAPWFIKFDNASKPWSSPACDTNYDPPKCTDYFHSQLATPAPSGGSGACHPAKGKGCDCGTKPCGFCEFRRLVSLLRSLSFLPFQFRLTLWAEEGLPASLRFCLNSDPSR
jgi:hypothetical protein